MTDIKHEIALQRRFTDIISGKDLKTSSHRHQVYNKLLYYRFEEVIRNAFGRLKTYLSPEEWHDLIMAFVRHGATSPFIWRVPNEFRKFAAKRLPFPFAKDMMWFEWVEIELMMQTPSNQTPKPFKTSRPYTLSKTARIKKLGYRVFERGDDRQFLKAKKSKSYLLVYLDPATEQVMYLEITEFMYRFLKSLKKSPSLEAALKTVSKSYGEKYAEVLAVIRPTLENFVQFGILR